MQPILVITPRDTFSYPVSPVAPKRILKSRLNVSLSHKIIIEIKLSSWGLFIYNYLRYRRAITYYHVPWPAERSRREAKLDQRSSFELHCHIRGDVAMILLLLLLLIRRFSLAKYIILYRCSFNGGCQLDDNRRELGSAAWDTKQKSTDIKASDDKNYYRYRKYGYQCDDRSRIRKNIYTDICIHGANIFENAVNVRIAQLNALIGRDT